MIKKNGFYYSFSKKSDTIVIFCSKESISIKNLGHPSIIGHAKFKIHKNYIIGYSFKEIGEAGIAPFFVHPKYRRLGIGTMMYKIASDITNKPIKQSECTDDGNEIWNYFKIHKIFPIFTDNKK